MSILIVMETDGKMRTVKKAFEYIGFTDIKVHSTKGRLFDLPKNRIGVNSRNFDDYERTAVSHHKVESLISDIKNSEVIFVATDDDIEGELIASDVFSLIQQHSSEGSESLRVRFKTITLEGIIRSLEEKTELDYSKVDSATSRRIFDRYIGYKLNKFEYDDEGYRGQIGRILTPVLSSLDQKIKSGQLTKAWVSKKFTHDGEDWSLKIGVRSDIEISDDALLSLIDDMPDPSIVGVSSTVKENPYRVMNGPSTLLSLSQALGATVIEVEDSIQRLYESGRISYPRTDSFYLSKEVTEAMAKMSEYFGVPDVDAEYLQEKAGNLQSMSDSISEAHDALYPIDLDLSPFADLEDYALDDQCMILMMRNALMAAQKNRVHVEKKAKLSDEDVNKPWIHLVGKISTSFDLSCSYTLRGDKQFTVQEHDPDISPMMSYESQLTHGSAVMRKCGKDEAVLKTLMEIGIDRPSTCAIHSNKISSRYMKDDWSLTQVAKDSLIYAQKAAPLLLDLGHVKSIESYFYRSDMSINDRISEAIRRSGIKHGQAGKSDSLNADNYFSVEDSNLDY